VGDEQVAEEEGQTDRRSGPLSCSAGLRRVSRAGTTRLILRLHAEKMKVRPVGEAEKKGVEEGPR